jgi:high-affinity nickel permease
MSAMDTADGAFTSQAYGWAFSNPIRKVVSAKLALTGGPWDWLNSLDFGRTGSGSSQRSC